LFIERFLGSIDDNSDIEMHITESHPNYQFEYSFTLSWSLVDTVRETQCFGSRDSQLVPALGRSSADQIDFKYPTSDSGIQLALSKVLDIGLFYNDI
jgi:hypothetical protein